MFFITSGIIILVISFAIALFSLIREQRLGNYALEVVEEEGKPIQPELQILGSVQVTEPVIEEIPQVSSATPEYTQPQEPVFNQADYAGKSPLSTDNFAYVPSVNEQVMEDDQIVEGTKQFFAQEQPNLKGEFSLASLRKNQ